MQKASHYMLAVFFEDNKGMHIQNLIFDEFPTHERLTAYLETENYSILNIIPLTKEKYNLLAQ